MDRIESIFQPGAAIQVIFVDREGNVVKSQSRVEDLEADYLVLQAPEKDSRPVKIGEGQELTLARLLKQAMQLYIASVFVIQVRPGKLPLLLCSRPQVFNKTSLRRYARFAVDLPCIVTSEGKSFQGRLLDLSPGGCSALLPLDVKLDQGSMVQFKVDIPYDQALNLSGEVVRCRPGEDKEGRVMAVAFSGLVAAEREKLIEYLFQHRLLQQGILGGGPDQARS